MNMEEQKKIKDWLQRLSFLQAENVGLKTKLAYKVQAASNNQVLDQAEYFQTQFLNKDVAISLLRHELSLNASTQIDLDDMEKSIRAMEEEQLKQKAAFADFLSVLVVS